MNFLARRKAILKLWTAVNKKFEVLPEQFQDAELSEGITWQILCNSYIEKCYIGVFSNEVGVLQKSLFIVNLNVVQCFWVYSENYLLDILNASIKYSTFYFAL